MCKACEIIKSLDSYSVEYLGWITAIVGGIIALTTIIFTHYNERSIEKSNDIVEEIKSILHNNKDNKQNIPYSELSNKFNKIINVLSNNRVYNITLIFFEVILYVLVALWFFGSLGYALNAKTWTERVLIMVASFILIAVFLFIPKIIKMFNKNQSLIITKNNKCSYNELLNFFRFNNILTKNDTIKNLIRPSLRISINTRDQIILEYNQKVSITDYSIIFKLLKGNEVIYICLHINSDKQSIQFSTDSNNGMTFRGLFDLIRTSTKIKSNIFISDTISENKVFKINNIPNDDGDIILEIGNQETITNNYVDDILQQKKSLIKVVKGSPNDEIDYELTVFE